MNHLHLCPVCLRKLHWCIGFDIRDHYTGLLDTYQEYGGVSEEFSRDCTFLQRHLRKLEALPDGATVNSGLPAGDRSRTTIPSSGLRGGGEVRRPRALSTPSAPQARSRRTSGPIFAQNA